MNAPGAPLHPAVIRMTHWINVVALAVMVASGLRIYNASPIFDFKFPADLTLGGWLGGARQWHFLAMWVFFANGFLWLLYNIVTRHGRLTTLFRAGDIGGVFPMVAYYLRLRRDPPPHGKYNALQKLAYTSAAAFGIGIILTGIAIYWPVQFGWLTAAFGRYDFARKWHFVFMSLLVLFSLGHLFMVAVSGWNNFLSMITGRKKEVPAREQ